MCKRKQLINCFDLRFLPLAGDLAPVTIGRGSAVLDNAVVSSVKGQPTTLGSEVTVCAGAVVQSASVGDGSMIGMGATVLPGATIGNDSFVDAGAVVAAGSKIGSGELWTGKPAQFLRKLSADEMSYLRTSATTTATLGQTHYGQGEMSVAQVEKQERLYVLRLEASMASNAPLPVPDPDVLEYYRLTTPKVNSELFRESEFDMAKLAAAKAEAELAADRAEEEYYYGQARLRRVGDAVKQLSEVRADRPAARDKVVRDLAARDPEGAQQLTALLARASAAAAGDAIAKEDVLRSIQAIDFTSTTAEEAKSAAEAAFNALSAHGKSLPPAGSQLLGAAASSASTAQAAAQ